MAGAGRLLGIDVGSKRVGVARTDPFRTFATPVDTFSVSNSFSEIKRQVKDEGPVIGIVVGWPLTPQGAPTNATPLAEAYIKKLEKDHPDIPIYKMDERFSSKEAGIILLNSGVPKKKRRKKGRLDQAVAAYILQEFLEANPDI